ncbi:MAG: DUF1588 domain-containing protein [Planctomycetaceae bacterium]|nr:DUF1588 domain-containing protein [Planctomycetaceae bacterium]
MFRLLWPACLLFVPFVVPAAYAADQMPADVARVFRRCCADCHSEGAAEGGFAFNVQQVNWADASTVHAFEDAHQRITRQLMPPPDAEQPTKAERQLVSDWLDGKLKSHSPIGGTTLRRLNRREYANTVASVFGLTDYRIPAGFPADSTSSGFDNQAESLVMAGSHLEAYAEAAADIADQLFPPPKSPVEPTTVRVAPDELVISYSSACLIDGAMRLGSSGRNFRRHATWPTLFEAPASGEYQLEIDVSAYRPPETTPLLDIGVMPMLAGNGPKSFQQLSVEGSERQTLKLTVPLNKGDTVVLRYANGPFDYDDADAYKAFLTEHLTQHPELAAAWDSLGKVARGGSGWQRLKEEIARPDLGIESFHDNPEAIAKVVKAMASNKVSSGETLVYKFFEQGPNLGIHGLVITGPHKPIQDRADIQSEKLRQALTGTDFDPTDPSQLRSFFDRFLPLAFRRPATGPETAGYVNLVETETRQTGSPSQGMHLAIRAVLLSPDFLYRDVGSGTLNDHDLATRLSYFLQSAPPDAQARKLIAAGHYSSPDNLRKETIRLLQKPFAADFTRQWLDLDIVETIMPDARLGKFSDRHRRTILAEAPDTFWFLWQKNRSVTDLITPDFVMTDAEVGWDIYSLERFAPKKMTKDDRRRKNKMTRVDVPRDGRHGGLLSMSAVMTATANGVDTQPVLRGVWLMQNILGSPPPEPPDSVPALTPDTSQATTVKQRLAAHMSEPSCAMCHREIDPLGFALENFDPVGRWRTTYPNFRSNTATTQPVDATGVLPDGTPIHDVTDLKRWLADHPEHFVRCLSEKLLTYATGRSLSYRERALVAEIVHRQQPNNYRFRDLVVALVTSEIFLTQ